MTIRGIIFQRVFLKVDVGVDNAKVKLSMFATNAVFHCMSSVHLITTKVPSEKVSDANMQNKICFLYFLQKSK